MPIFPSMTAAFVEGDGGHTRQLLLADCKPGDLVQLLRTGTCALHLVVRVEEARGPYVIEFGANGISLNTLFYDEPVVRINSAATFIIDHSSARLANDRNVVGVIRANSLGTSLITEMMPGRPMAFDLVSFDRVGLRDGIDFTRWSIELTDEHQRRMTVYTHNAER